MDFTVRQDGPNVLIISNGKLVSIMPWDAALIVSKAIHAKAKQAEEIAKADQIIQDNAILARVGSFIGLSSHPKIVEETKKEAAFGSIRKYITSRIESKEIAYPPIIKRGLPCSNT